MTRRVIAYADLAARVRAVPPRLGPVRLVAVDGGAGSGKTSFAARLAAALDGVPVLHTDDFLDGWRPGGFLVASGVPGAVPPAHRVIRPVAAL